MAIKYFSIGAVLFLASCTVGPNFTSSWQSISLPTGWRLHEKEQQFGQPSTVRPEKNQAQADWWAVFGDETLNRLETQLATQNPDIQTAISRLEQARAQRGIVAAGLYPTLGGAASVTRQKPSDKGAFSLFGAGAGGGASASSGGMSIPSSNKIPPFNIWQYGFDASWELDLWGGSRRAVESASATVMAAEEMQRDTLLSVQAELARDYLEVRGAQAVRRVLKNYIKSARSRRDLVVAQAKSGLTSQEDTTSAEAQLEMQTAQLPQIDQQESEGVNQITLLLGLAPGDLDQDLKADKSPLVLPKTIPLTAPSDLIRNRPDIREAEAKLHAATAEIGVATASFYPQITLMGNGSIQAVKFGGLNDWSARTWSLGPSISLPIFEGGRLTRTLQLRKAEQKEAAIAYRKTVLTAFQEVDDALTSLLAEQQRQIHLAQAEKQQNLAVDFAAARYKNGLASFLDVIVAQQNIFDVERQMIESRTILSTNLIQFYKALGANR